VKCPAIETALSKEITVDTIIDSCSDCLVKCQTIDIALSKKANVDAILIAVPIE
jgi:hypothetical protein